jgi:tight adherence protein C
MSVNHFDQILTWALLSFVLTAATFAVLAVIISMLNYRESPVRDRLLMLKEKTADGDFTFQGSHGAFDDLKTAILNFSKPISKNLYGENKKYFQQIKTLLTEAGLPDQDIHVTQFMAQRVAVGLVIGVVLFMVSLVLSKGLLFVAISFLIGGFLFGSMIPQMMLRNRATKRKLEIRYTMPDTLDLMVVCVEAGLGLDATMQKVAEETERLAPDISYEFKRLNKELSAGISRTEAFQNLGQRAGVDELRSLCAMIIQSDKMGTSIADTLRVFADDLRTKRRQRAEELASKASIKMTFPLVFFIFPPLFIILMGPVVINTINQFFSK